MGEKLRDNVKQRSGAHLRMAQGPTPSTRHHETTLTGHSGTPSTRHHEDPQPWHRETPSAWHREIRELFFHVPSTFSLMVWTWHVIAALKFGIVTAVIGNGVLLTFYYCFKKWDPFGSDEKGTHNYRNC